MQERDFSSRKYFPGTEGGPFELILRLTKPIESIPGFLFASLLFGLALLINTQEPLRAAILWVFFLGDWGIMMLLRKGKRSFGPPKPPALLLAVLRSILGWLPIPALLVIQSIGTLLVIYSFWYEPLHIVVTTVELNVPELPQGYHLRVLHLGDLHLERLTMREHRLIELVHDLRPDLILFSGDFLSFSTVDDPEAIREANWLLSQLDAPLGCFAVTGSPPVDLEHSVQQIITGTGWRLLRDERVVLGEDDARFDLYGVSCTHRPFVDGPKLENLIEEDGESFGILLYHSPDLAPVAARLGIKLQLSGHTHGGQVRLPFFGAVYTSSLYGKRLEAGCYRIGSMMLYVTRGIGLEGKGAPRVRFLCPPEMTLWTLQGAPAEPGEPELPPRTVHAG